MSSSRLQLSDIQGLAIHGYGMSHARFRYYRFVDPAEGRAWSGALADPITTAEEWSEKPASCVNLALSYAGLEALGIDEHTLSGFPQDFTEGMAARAAQLADAGPNAPDHWEHPFHARALHALLMVWGQGEEALEAQIAEIEALRPAGVELLGEQPAVVLDDGREHFGYRDGISPSPAIAGYSKPRPGQAGPVQPGEFILGYPDEIGQIAGSGLREELRNNSTYLVYRKLYQDVASFRAFLRAHARDVEGEELLAAKLVGRWRSGTPLVLSPDVDKPALADDVERRDDFDYQQDPLGLVCPKGAHVRRARPRSPGDTRHLLVRRGLPYGPPLPEGAPDDGRDRGLLGIFSNASIERQFEFVQRAWLANPAFNGLSNEVDPLAGLGGTYTIPGRFLPRRITGMPRFVTVRGGEYLLLPSVSALRWLAAYSQSRSASSSRLRTPSFT